MTFVQHVFYSEWSKTVVYAKKEGLKLNGTYQLLVYADNFKPLCRVVWCGRKTTVKENEEALVAS
jgi:hypothetical protein